MYEFVCDGGESVAEYTVVGVGGLARRPWRVGCDGVWEHVWVNGLSREGAAVYMQGIASSTGNVAHV